MKPTCPTTCPLKQTIDQHKRSVALEEEFLWTLEQRTPFERRRVLAIVTYAYYKLQGFAKLSTWIEILEQQRVLFFIWGFFEIIHTAMIRGRW
jgi:hypothetical protein